jgi:hypothetical protein
MLTTMPIHCLDVGPEVKEKKRDALLAGVWSGGGTVTRFERREEQRRRPRMPHAVVQQQPQQLRRPSD